MSKLLLLDFETTGLNTITDRITEYCFLYWDTVTGQTAETHGYLYERNYPKITDEITQLTRVTEELLKEKGEHPSLILDRFAQTAMKVDFLVAHNARSFDKPILEAECHRHGVSFPKVAWIDTRTDLPYRARLKCRVLSHLAMEYGYKVDMEKAHGAREDVLMLKHILEKQDLEQVLKLCAEPQILVKATVSFHDREKAKSRGYSWENVGSIQVLKTWIKVIRESEWDRELLTMNQAGVPLIKTVIGD